MQYDVKGFKAYENNVTLFYKSLEALIFIYKFLAKKNAEVQRFSLFVL
jgi:hypothetical protein